MFRNRIVAAAMIVLLHAMASGCSAAGTAMVFLEPRQARLDGDRLSVVVDSCGHDAFERVRNARQYVVSFRVADGAAQHLETSRVAFDQGSGGSFLIGANGDRVLWVRGLGLTVINGKVYPIAELLLFTRTLPSLEWTKDRTWKRAPFFADPDLTRLVRLEDGIARVYAPPTGGELNFEGANELFTSIGSSWDQAPENPPVDGVDRPPDFAGLTSGCDYASADGGIIFAKFIYEHAQRRRRDLPRAIDLPAPVGRVWVDDVKRNVDGWEFLCLKSGPLPSRPEPAVQPPEPVGLVVVAEAGNKIVGFIAESDEVREFSESTGLHWNPRERTVLAFDRNENAAQTGRFTFKLWRYDDPKLASRLMTISLDMSKLFKQTDKGFEPTAPIGR